MKWLFPFDRFEFVSVKTAAESAATLQHHTSPIRLFRLKAPDKQFAGVVSHNGFKISPVITYRNSFSPVIIGAFLPHQNGVRISVFQRPPVFTLAFMTIWLGLTWFIGGANAFADEGGLADKLFVLAMTAFAFALTSGGFWWEARHTKDELITILDGSEIGPL